MKRLFRKGQRFNDWELISFLGSGGNGEVWTCKNSKGEDRAIKLLKRIKPKSYRRFIDEATAIEQNNDIKGIIPIIEKHLPEKLDGQTPFFIMPLAVSSENTLRHKSIEEKVKAIIQIVETLSELHEREIYHRDIKPANILFFEGRYSLADFGLVEYPNKKDISHKNEEIGAKWTMAPEMRRESSSANLAKADIYSLAKTFWIFLTDRSKGFDGQYSTESIIDLKKFYPKSYTSPIDNLLIHCTDNDPQKRLTLNQFIHELKNWQVLTEDFHKQNQQQWFEIQTKLFPTSIPNRVIWEDINDIIKVLKIVCSFDNLSHVFMPTGGGLDLEDVRISHEKSCIELDFQAIEIVKPKRLLFESFNYDHEWNYFRLELDELAPAIVKQSEIENPSVQEDYEVVSELSPGNYYPDYILEDRTYYSDQYLIPDNARQISRMFRGTYVIFCKRSSYNLDSSTYDARHNKMGTEEFREYIARSVNNIKQKKQRREYIETDFFEEKRVLSKQNFEHYIEELTIHRCGYCGNFVDSSGRELQKLDRDYNIKVYEKYGHKVVKQVHGSCCIAKYMRQ